MVLMPETHFDKSIPVSGITTRGFGGGDPGRRGNFTAFSKNTHF